MADSSAAHFRVALDLPLSAEEARKRGFAGSVCRLILAPRDRRLTTVENVTPTLGHWISRWKDGGWRIYMVPWVVFASGHTLASLVSRGYIRHWKVADEDLVTCQDEDSLGAVLRELRCEELTVMYAADDAMAQETVQSVADNRARCESQNGPFLQRLEQHGGFVFFSDTHLSLEVLGTAEFVYKRCFRSLLAWCGSAWKLNDCTEETK